MFYQLRSPSRLVSATTPDYNSHRRRLPTTTRIAVDSRLQLASVTTPDYNSHRRRPPTGLMPRSIIRVLTYPGARGPGAGHQL
ncbi:hypothetical protein EVAR_85106_1 [Eumeta japonica]|uniref:Uncharacterized protein n=1 Tax=Eumeta variegata TaxID=151549 RepID=A0A4C1XQQ8_EUMVA|nr:hypothetical protein EVAR_85106_1 [Eumeta japonica]